MPFVLFCLEIKRRQMENVKVTPQEIYEVLEQQKKLADMRAKLVGVLNKVNQTINLITVENLELTSCQIEYFDEKEEIVDIKPNIPQQTLNDNRAEEINQQLIDLELKFTQFEAESDESELDL